jgi:hypothetical protein
MVHQAIGMEHYNKYWTVGTIIGSLPNQSSFKYYLEPQLRLIDDVYVFNQLFALGGLGYQLNTKAAFFVGSGWVMSQTSEGYVTHEKRFWQQLNWQLTNLSSLNMMSRTRLEERKNSNASEMAIRLRERIWIRIPIKNSERYSWSCFDEIFFNLNHPDWVSPYSFEQNRAFIGIASKITKSTMVDVGYLNQYIRSFKNQSGNVLLLNITINW